jgi:hypothetical protein
MLPAELRRCYRQTAAISWHDIIDPPVPSGSTKDGRYHSAYSFDQSLDRSKENPEEGVGLL